MLDSLEDALVRVLLAELIIEEYRAEEVASALAAAVRECMRKRMPTLDYAARDIIMINEASEPEAFYTMALYDMARRFGL